MTRTDYDPQHTPVILKQDLANAPEKNAPIETLRDGALKVSIFRNRAQNGDYYNYVPARLYTDEKTGQVRETRNLSGSDPLRMANLLHKSYDRVAEFKHQMKNQARTNKRSRE